MPVTHYFISKQIVGETQNANRHFRSNFLGVLQYDHLSTRWGALEKSEFPYANHDIPDPTILAI
jgi:hypothetical protein